MQLTDLQREKYKADGYVGGLTAFGQDEAHTLRTRIETLERTNADGAGGHNLNQFFRVNGHLVIPLLSEIARTPAIIDQVSDILGPNLLVWSVELFIKEPNSPSIVSWHQDLTYWGMGETDEELTAWVALSDVSIKAGCMRFIPGSHTGQIVAHTDTFGTENLLSRGQEIAGINEGEAAYAPLSPGQMSFHHGRCFHASGPNMTADRRIGCAIRYVTPEVHQTAGGSDYAMLVRGVDAVQGWINVAPPHKLFDPSDLERYETILVHQAAALTQGAADNVALYQA